MISCISTRVDIHNCQCKMSFVARNLYNLYFFFVFFLRNMTPSRNYQQELVNTESTPVEYSFPEHQGYSEYDPRQMLEIENPEHRFKDSQSRKSRFEHYESINSKHVSTKVKAISS